MLLSHFELVLLKLMQDPSQCTYEFFSTVGNLFKLKLALLHADSNSNKETDFVPVAIQDVRLKRKNTLEVSALPFVHSCGNLCF